MSIAAIVNDTNTNNKVTTRRLTGFANRKPANESDDSSDLDDISTLYLKADSLHTFCVVTNRH